MAGSGRGEPTPIWPLLVFAVVAAVWSLASQLPLLRWGNASVFLGPDGALSFLEEHTLDWRLAARGPLPPPVDIIYVNVDTQAIEKIGNFPWSREVFAQALDALFDLGRVRAVGMDFVFSNAGIPQMGHEQAQAGSLAFGKAINEHQRVVLAAAFESSSRKSGGFPAVFERRPAGVPPSLPELPAYPVVGPTWGHIGLITTVGEGVRLLPAFADCGEHTYYTMALELALLLRGQDESSISLAGNELRVAAAPGTKGIHAPLVMGQLLEPNWFGAWDDTTNVSIFQVLAYAQLAREGNDEDRAAAANFFKSFEGATILIGPTDPLLKDVSVLPMSGQQPVPRVSIHGNLLQTIMSGRFLHRLPTWANAGLILLLALLGGAGAMAPTKWVWKARFAAMCLIAGYVAAAFLLFARWDIILPLVAPVGAALTCSFMSTALQLSREQQQKRRIQDLFGSYVSSAVVEEMVERHIPPQTGGAEVEITAFFSDIASFSGIAEELRPRELVELMSEYLGGGTAAIIEQNGTLDKYVGDAIVAIFGAPLPCPDHAAAACRAALGVQAAQIRLCEKWMAEGDRWTARVKSMRTRVGLHSGPAVVGNIGSKLRFNYTMMGDTVNLAQRMEAAGSYYGTGILVSGDVAREAGRDDPGLVFRPLDRVLVPGRVQPVDVFELIGHGEDCRKDSSARLQAYAAALAVYRSGDWLSAREAFMEAAKFEQGEKNPALAMAARCLTLKETPAVQDYVFSLKK